MDSPSRRPGNRPLTEVEPSAPVAERSGCWRRHPLWLVSSFKPVLAIDRVGTGGQERVQRGDEATDGACIRPWEPSMAGENQTGMRVAAFNVRHRHGQKVGDVLGQHRPPFSLRRGEDDFVRLPREVGSFSHRDHVVTATA